MLKVKRIFLLLIFTAFLLPASALASQPSLAAVEDSTGLVRLLEYGGNLAQLKFIGWAEGWDWDPPKQNRVNNGPGTNFEFSKQHVAMNFRSRKSSTEIVYDFDLTLNQDVQATIGAGIALTLTPEPNAPSPELLPNNTGLIWAYKKGKELRIEFAQPIASIKFDRNNKYRIRAFFFKDKITSGELKVQMKVSLPEHTFIKADEHSKKRLREYETNLGLIRRNHEQYNSKIDLSYLNHKPAGKFGFVKAKGSDLVYQNGQHARFYGVNIQAYSLFIEDKETIKKHAKRLAKLGVNLARLHHHDSATWVRKSLIENGHTTQKINAQALDSYHWWIHCLKEEGIYVWIDLQVGRPWRSGDNVPGWNSDFKIRKGMAKGEGFIYLNEKMVQLTKKFNEKLLLTTNPYTNLNLVQEPAIMGVTITNENDLTSHFANRLINGKKHPYHNKLFEAAATEFGKRLSLWDRSSVKKTWLPGYSKVFLNDLEAKFNANLSTHLRKLGLKVPISTTSVWGKKTSLFSLPSISSGDIIDTHTYSKKNPLKSDPKLEPNLAHAIGYAQVPDKPFSVSEYNTEDKFAASYSHILIPYFATQAAFQDWDAIMLYGYSQDGFRAKTLSPWSSHANPNFLELAPASALIYRDNHIDVAKQSMVITDLEDKIFNENISPFTSLTYRTLMDQHRVTTALPKNEHLPWLKASKVGDDLAPVPDLNKNFLTTQTDIARSDTGQLTRDWQLGLFTIQSEKTQGSIGGPENKPINLSSARYSVEQPDATIIFSSLDDKVLNNSADVLLTTVGKLWTRNNKRGFISLSKNITGKFEFRSKLPELSISPLNGTKEHSVMIESRANKNQYIHTFKLTADSDATQYQLSLSETK